MENQENKHEAITGKCIVVAADRTADHITNDIDELHQLEVLQAADAPIATNTDFVLHKAASRGHADHGWLQSYQTFSFADYYNPERMHFGVLRVLNDDILDPSKGFGRHPHDNMEIISIPLEGDLEHEDSMGNKAIIRNGDVQAMTAGTGIFHTEYNKNDDQKAKFLQIWLFPKSKNSTPRYDQVSFNVAERHNNLQQILSPDSGDAGVTINQDAWFHIGKFDQDFVTKYTIKKTGNGVYIFVLNGEFHINGHTLNKRDGLGLWNLNDIPIHALTPDAEILIMDIPMAIL